MISLFPKRLVLAVLGLSAGTLGFAASGCSSSSTTPGLSSLRQSGDVTFFCVGPGGAGAPLERCPIGQSIIGSTTSRSLTVASPDHDLFALITQTVSGEVAVVRVSARTNVSGPTVIDVDPSNPGVTPLRVGQNPGDIVTTPGGSASFVGVREPGKPGIFALPTECVWAPRAGETLRDLTSWPACSLPAAPGEMVVVVDPADAEGRVRSSCTDAYMTPGPQQQSAEDANLTDCRVELSREEAAPGRQKLIVSLPDRGSLVVVDAQTLLDRAPGSFGACPIEAELRLSGNANEEAVQPLPNDLANQGCFDDSIRYASRGDDFVPRPAGLALGPETLFVGDQGAPLIHRVSVLDPCALAEEPPLLPTSLTEPSRVVTSSRLALSPVTTSGSRFLYAIDEMPGRPANVMIFDVSSSGSPRTPLVREGSKEMPFEAPDRLEFAAAARDVVFVQNDEPEVDPDSEVGEFGVYCDPDPDSRDAGARYRSNESLSAGAGVNRRGIFAYVLTSDGYMNVVDVEDYDTPCRRPIQANSSATPDFRGCVDDPTSFDYYTSDGSSTGAPTVTGEASCRVVAPHRARSRGNRGFLITNETFGTGAPALLTLPRLTFAGRGLPLSRDTEEGRKRPIVLGTDFGGPLQAKSPAQVFVGTTLRSRDSDSTPLIIDPNVAEQGNVVLPLVEPRAYPQREVVSIAYEGDLDGLHGAGTLVPTTNGKARFVDPDAAYCDIGAQDVKIVQELLARDFDRSAEAFPGLGKRYADYVQITSPLPVEEDDYWDNAGKACVGGEGYAGCDSLFGKTTVDDLRRERDLRILSAFQGFLEVEPRNVPGGGDASQHLEEMLCCFPGPLSYRLRAPEQWVVRGTSSGFSHPVVATATADGQFSCELACDPIRGARRGRAFELSTFACDSCGVGTRGSDDVLCVYDASRGPVQPGTDAGRCIYDNGTRRFAVYRGLEKSQRGMLFTFDVGGGFVIDTINMSATTRTNVLPTTAKSVPPFGVVGVVDSQDRGLLLVDVRSNSLVTQFF